MDKFSYISHADVGYLDQLYQNYKKDANSVDATWQKFFEGYEFSQQRFGENGAVADGPSIKETQVRNLIFAYRSFGHLKAFTNPVRERRNHSVNLDLKFFGLSDADLETEFDVAEEISLKRTSLRKIIEKLQAIYMGPIGFEYNYIRNDEVREWFAKKCEIEYYSHNPSLEEKKRILSKLNEAVVFENFLHTKFLGQKRFSLEGGENTIPALDAIINKLAEMDVKEVVIGMAHRGRLNVLSNILGKTYEQIFTEFEGNVNPDDLTMGDGDVKYHLGYASHINTPSGKKIYVKLTPNPSHLEAVDPLVIGYTRGQIDDEYNGDLTKAMSILIHGDAAVAGQGIVYEIVQMSGLPGYTTGGTIHFVINNQVGFTTDFDDARTAIYCTDVAKIIDAPILHVNGDDAEAVTFCSNLSVEYRQKFGNDIFIDMLCYRRHGHNESDEPKFTQPKLYNIIAKHPNPREVYVKKLVSRGVDSALADEMDKNFRNQLQDRLNEVKQKPLPYKPQKIEEEWEQLRKAKAEDFDQSPKTAITQAAVDKVGKAISTIPDGFKPLKQIEKLIKDRKTAFFEDKKLGWAEAELLAYGSLLLDKIPVRFTGQDVKRGTFSHRHAYFWDANTNETYCGLDNIEKDQEKFHIYNSLLSEFGVLGFEYGYAMATPHALVIWEAQFGDFANGAQVMIDQFICSAESKWQRQNGMVMLLPHGYEGQGPEHSNARPERFLQLSAEYNMIVANLTTAANFFHLLRRQVSWDFRKPCVVMSPKSLLRHEAVVSPMKDFTSGTFMEVLDDPNAIAKDVKRVVLCSGKIFFDLQEVQQKKKIKDAAIVRLEQLHPFPEKQLDTVLKKYKNAKLVWAQEEPSNMGYWTYILRYMSKTGLEVVSRKASASPATGYSKVHKAEQEKIVNQAFEI